MKAPSPAFSIYPKDIDSDENCKAMTLAEFGAYMRLLLNCWTEGSIPADPVRIQRLLKISPRTFASIWPSVSPCFQPSGTRLVQRRLQDEERKQRERSRVNSENGSKGGRPLESTKQESERLPEQKPLETEEKGRARASSPSPSSVTSPYENPGRSVEVVAPNRTPLKFEHETTKLLANGLTPKDLGFLLEPSQYAHQELAWAITRLVASRNLHGLPEKRKAAVELLHDASRTPAGLKIETLDLRRVSPAWVKITTDRLIEIAADVYGVSDGRLFGATA